LGARVDIRIPFSKSIANSGNAIGNASETAGTVWLATAGDRTTGNDETEVILTKTGTWTPPENGKKMVAGVVITIPEADRYFASSDGRVEIMLEMFSTLNPSLSPGSRRVEIVGGYTWKNLKDIMTPSGKQFTTTLRSTGDSRTGFSYQVRVKIRAKASPDHLAGISGGNVSMSMGLEGPII
jgi:hypothetical protein